MSEENNNMTEQQENAAETKQEEASQKKGINIWSVIFPVAVILILGAFFGVVLINKNINDQKEDQKKISITGYDVKSVDDLCNNYIQIGKYKGLQYEVTQEMFDELLAEDTQYYETVERKSRDTDSVSFNITGYVDGKKDKNITLKDQEVIVGEDTDGSFKVVSDLVKGKKAGDEIKDVQGIDPNEISDDGTDYTGKNVTFTIKVVSVSKLVVDQVTDQWVKENFEEEGFTTVKDYYEYIEDSLEQEVMSDLWEKVVSGSVCKKYPEDAYSRIIEEVDQDYAYEADQWGMETDEYYKVMQYTEEDIEKEYENEMTSEMAAWVIAFQEDFYEVSDEEIEDWWLSNYEEYGYDSVEDMKQDYKEEEIVRAIVLQKAAEFVYDNAKITKSYTKK